MFVRASRATLVVALAALTATSGCAASEVKSRFENDAACPAARVTVTEAGTVPPSAADPPPPDVAADPERRAIYERTHQGPDVGRRVFVAEGCGRAAKYVCDHDDGHGHHWCVKQ